MIKIGGGWSVQGDSTSDTRKPYALYACQKNWAHTIVVYSGSHSISFHTYEEAPAELDLLCPFCENTSGYAVRAA